MAFPVLVADFEIRRGERLSGDETSPRRFSTRLLYIADIPADGS